MRKINRFKLACVEYLGTQTISTLRAYGRFLQMRDCTNIKKGELLIILRKIKTAEKPFFRLVRLGDCRAALTMTRD